MPANGDDLVYPSVSGTRFQCRNNGSARNSTNNKRITCIAVTNGTDNCRVSAVRLISAIPPGIMPSVSERKSRCVNALNPTAADVASNMVNAVPINVRAMNEGARRKN